MNLDDPKKILQIATDGNVSVPTSSTSMNGLYYVTADFDEVTYQLNVTDGGSDSSTFTEKDGVMVRNVPANTVIKVKFPDGTFAETGTSFVNKSATPEISYTVGDDGYLTIDTIGKYNLTIGEQQIMFYANINIGGSIDPTDNSYYRPVTNTKDAFVYERVNVIGATNNLTMFSSGSNPTVINQIAGNEGNFYLTEDVVGGHYGKYVTDGDPESPNFIYIWYPELSIQGELTQFNADGTVANPPTAGDSIDGKTINKDTQITFLLNAPKVGPAFYDKANNTAAKAKLVFTTPVAGKTTYFGGDFSEVSLASAQTSTSSVEAGESAPAGTWTVQAEYIKFYLDDMHTQTAFADYAKKSNTISFTLQSSTLTITAAKDSVVRSNPFTVTISGKAQTVYAVFIEDWETTNDITPSLQEGQSGYQQGTDRVTPKGQIAGADFKTDASGKRTIQYNTAANTEDKTYTIKVQGYKEDGSLDSSDYDKVKVKVEKGGVTISASGDGSYYIGDEIKLTGTNTDSSNVYLFITGQNLDSNGIILKSLPNKYAAMYNTNPVSVKTDNTWEYKWDTSQIALDTGAYTVYATSRVTNGKSSSEVLVTTDAEKTVLTEPYTAVKLSDSEYATVSINLKQPFLSAVPSGTIVAKGDKIYIRGTAEGQPNSLNLYIFGPNFFEDHSITVEDDGSYEKKIEISSDMSSNQYFVVVQHPMYNGKFDAVLDKTTKAPEWYFHTSDVNTGGDAQAFVVWGSSNKLQGSQAADALTKMIDSANIDDIYTKLTFTVAEPWIRINNPGDQAAGSKFTITGTTNLAVDDQILVEVMSSSFTAVDKTSTSTTSGVSQTTKVVKGDTDNTWSVDVDTTNWKLDEYTIKVNGIEVDVTTTTNFNLVEKVVTPTPTATATGATPTTTTAPATTTPTQTPGFGAFIALAGLGAVALLVLRRN
ncbi:MAG TPA: MEMAR_RS02690 family S-layer glycoprotein [Methanocorpusculum sp.]|nr:MEMAR_RS02690 family S-layer glycoprotein [Methanocorpusculum sp.]HJK81184.1 MEMAR_RS02690 family S-layer glycoprotein [Methanocorpusculum sp.]